MGELKRFTKGCAVDVRGWDELPYGEILLAAIKKFSDGFDSGNFAKYEGMHIDGNDFLYIREDGLYIFGEGGSPKNMLTPIDILGEHLVKAIEDGYTPWFEGDSLPIVENKTIWNDGSTTIDNPDHSFRWVSSPDRRPIAYKPIEQPIEDSRLYKEAIRQQELNAKILAEKVGPSILSRSYEELTELKAIHDSMIKLTATQEAKAANWPHIEALFNEVMNKEGE